MAVTRMSRLRDCGVFRDFTWPTDLAEFGRYNLIYGWNGSGKTTFSRLLRALEAKTTPTTGQVAVEIDGRDVRGDQFAQVTLPVRVFNRDFMAENVFPTGGGELPPIFVLGKESVEKQKDVDRLKTTRTDTEARLSSTRSKKQDAERAFDKLCIDRARVIKDTLRSSGPNPYNNYNKSDFQGEARKMIADGSATSCRLAEQERGRLLAQHQAIPKPKVNEATYALPDFETLVSNVSQVLTTTVVSTAINALKDDPMLAQWTREGLALHRDRQAEQCLFCEQSLPNDRLAALEAHFNTQYEQFIQRLEQLIRQTQAASKAASDLRLPKRAELYDDLTTEYDEAESKLQVAVDAARGFLDAAEKALVGKKGRVFERIEFDVTAPTVESGAVDHVNSVIRKHNLACDEFQTRVDAARKRLALNMIAEEFEEFARLTNAVHQADADVAMMQQEVQRLNDEIARLEREIVEHRQPAEDLNTDLRKYLGHDELRLEIKDTGYTIMRDGVPALTLSEGEMTAIALLYFLKSLQDRRFELAKGVVVLDDPVSSLDANALYLAFGFIRERTQEAGQLFILTHNFSLFRQVRNWFHHLKGQNKRDIDKRPARFFMLDCAHNQNGRCATIRWLDPLLEQYESEYHYLFACVHRAASAAADAALEKNYGLPNVARRFLEMFLAFRRPQIAGELWEKMKDMEFDEAKKIRIIRFVHTHSHGDTIGESEHDPSLLGESRAVLADLLEFIKTQDAEHFEAMTNLVSSSTENEGSK